ncbi:MAG: ABC transporter permease [Firmicutes bacterium]|nr:ABC transporter permease [Bacillota bacterium]
MGVFQRLHQYHEFLMTNIHKEIRGKYKKSFLGILWSFLNPLLMLMVYAIIYPIILKSPEKNYTMFLMTALIPWNFFTACITQGTSVIIANGNILKKVYFPREILPISTVTSGLVNFLISCIIICIFLIFSGIGFSKYLIFFPLYVFIEYILILGIVFILSAITVYLRDLEHIVGVVIQVLFFGTPIVYSLSAIPAGFSWVFKLNPMSYIVQGFRDILYYQKMPDLAGLALITAFSFILLFVGYHIFSKLQRKFAEEL